MLVGGCWVGVEENKRKFHMELNKHKTYYMAHAFIHQQWLQPTTKIANFQLEFIKTITQKYYDF